MGGNPRAAGALDLRAGVAHEDRLACLWVGDDGGAIVRDGDETGVDELQRGDIPQMLRDRLLHRRGCLECEEVHGTAHARLRDQPAWCRSEGRGAPTHEERRRYGRVHGGLLIDRLNVQQAKIVRVDDLVGVACPFGAGDLLRLPRADDRLLERRLRLRRVVVRQAGEFVREVVVRHG